MATTPTLQIDRSLRRSLRLFDDDRLRWLDEAAALGPLVKLKLGYANTWIVTDPDVARSVLVTEAEQWRRPSSAVVPVRLGVGENLFTQSDRHWALVQPALSPAFRKRNLAPRLAALPRLIDNQLTSVPIGATIDLEALTNRIALGVAAWVLFGEELPSDRADEISSHQQEVVRWVGERLGQLRSTVPWTTGAKARRMKDHRAVLDSYAHEVVSRAKSSCPDPDGVMAALLNARPNGKPLSEHELQGHVLGLLFAGNETTAAALAWHLVQGARHPTHWAALRSDPRRASAFVDETMRLSPAVWGFARASRKGGATLASGAVTTPVRRTDIVVIYVRGMHRDPTRWAEATEFRPDRHHALNVEQQRSMIPFGLGPRGCIGQHLALAELHEAVPALARIGDIELTNEPVEDPTFALRFAGGLRGCFIPTPQQVDPVPIG